MNIREFAKEVAAITPAIHMALVRRQPKALAKGKITFSQMVILGLLRAKKECKMGEISKALGVTKSAVTGITDRLIKSGLLRRSRSKSDRRVVYITLAPKGVNLSRQLRDFNLRVVSNLFSNISHGERSSYLAILRKVRKNISRKVANNPHE